MAPALRRSGSKKDEVKVISKKSKTDFKAKTVTNENDFESIRQKNIEERRKIFEELKISEAVNELSDVIGSKKQTASQRGLASKNTKSLQTAEPERKSLRLQKIDADTGLQLPEKEPTKYFVTVEDRPRPPLDISLKDVVYWKDNEDNEDEFKKKENNLKKISTGAEWNTGHGGKPNPTGVSLKTISKLKIKEEQVAKVTPSRIFSMAINPITSKLLVAVGDKWGAVGLWDVNNTSEENHGVEVIYPHSRPINCLTFDNYHPSKLISSSYDGTVRSFDIDQQKFQLIYGPDDEDDSTYTGYHCQVDEHTFLVSLGRTGIVGMVDRRISNTSRVRDYHVYNQVSARMATLHPVQRHLFMSLNTKADCGIFDLRGKHKTMVPVMALRGHSRAISSALFSPVTGNEVVTVCYDNKLRIYDTSRLDNDVMPKRSVSHNNQTGRWLTTFKAEWHPVQEDLFFVGSMSSPRQIDVYHSNGEHCALRGDDLSSICSIVKGHPSLDVVVGGNSSGRVFVFK